MKMWKVKTFEKGEQSHGKYEFTSSLNKDFAVCKKKKKKYITYNA